MKLSRHKAKDQTFQDAIRGSVPDGRLSGARIILLPESKSRLEIEGMTTYGTGDVVETLHLPRGRGGYASTVRSHETRHARFSKRHSPRLKKLIKANPALAFPAQIIEDCFVEQKPFPCMDASALRGYCRDHVVAALADINEIWRHFKRCERNPEREENSIDERNGRLLVATRAIAMLNQYGKRSGSEHWADGLLRMQEMLGSLYPVVERIGKTAHNEKNRMKCIRMLCGLQEMPEIDESDFPDPIKIPLIEGLGLGVACKIIDLNPKKPFAINEKKVSVTLAPSGPIIRPERYVAAMRGDPNGLFARRSRHNPSGTVVIDASGSMHANTHNLRTLCRLIPDATIAYYSGDDVSRGTLAIYAFNGKRYEGELPEETVLGGNSVDLEAVQWLIHQKKPWTLISDLQFCGSSYGGEEIAHAIVERERAKGNLEVIPTFQEAFTRFSKKVKRPVLPHAGPDPEEEEWSRFPLK